MKGQWADRGPSEAVHCPATPAEEKIFEELATVWLPNDGGTSVSSVPLFPYTLLKSFLSSHTAFRATVAARIKTLEKKDDPRGTAAELSALHRLAELSADMTEADSAKFGALVEQLKAIGVGPSSDTRVVVFSERVQTLEWLATVLPAALGFRGRTAQGCTQVMHGGLSDEQQMDVVEKFGLAGAPVRILLTGDVASEGVNLHRQCHQLVHYDVPWSLIRIEQRNGRIDRYGQAHQPQFRALILTSKVEGAKDDTLVSERLLEREDQAYRALGTAEAVSGLYRAEAEEKSLIQDLLRGKTVDESLDARQSGADTDAAVMDDFLADFFGSVGEHPAEAADDAAEDSSEAPVPKAPVSGTDANSAVLPASSTPPPTSSTRRCARCTPTPRTGWSSTATTSRDCCRSSPPPTSSTGSSPCPWTTCGSRDCASACSSPSTGGSPCTRSSGPARRTPRRAGRRSRF